MEELDELRNKINEVDNKITALLCQRMEISQHVGIFKENSQLKVYQKARESELLEQLLKSSNEVFSNEIVHIYKTILQTSRSLQYKGIPNDSETLNYIFDTSYDVVYAGEVGSYAYLAANKLFKHKIQVQSFLDVIKKVENSNLLGILPIENSSHGDVVEVIDLLRFNNVQIIGEIDIPITHCLLGVKGTNKDKIKIVESHTQAIGQCINYIHNNHFEVKMSTNTASAAKNLANSFDCNLGVIASKEAALKFGLDILDENIQDEHTNMTKFVIISNAQKLQNVGKKTSIILETEHTSGSLASVLNLFELFQINLTNLQSRPVRNNNWKYQFFITFEGELINSKIKKILTIITTEIGTVKVLGTYDNIDLTSK